MSFTANTAFLPRMWNNRNDDLQNIPGQFGAMSDSTWVPADCSAGWLCNKGAHMSGGGYQMTVAADGKSPIYICNPGDVQRGMIGGNMWAEGAETLGLGIPAGVIDTFSEAKAGETYAFGPGNFSTLVTTTNIYATISNGQLVGSSTAPSAGSGVYFVLDQGLGIDVFTEGNMVGMSRYNLLCQKN